MMPPDLVYPWSPPPLPEPCEPWTELPDLSWLFTEQELQAQGIGDLSSDHHHLGLGSAAIGHGSQVDYYPVHDDATVTPQFGDAHFSDLLDDLSKPNASSEQDIHHHEVDNKIYSIVSNDNKAAEQTNSNQKIKGCTKRSKLENLVHTLGVWGGHRPRKCRIRRTYWRSYLLGVKKSFAYGSGKNTRKNNPHWTKDEVSTLLEGLSEFGVGSWTKIQKAYFGTSIRKPVHLKDKWKNLTEACGPEVRSKKKVQAQKSTQEILRRFEDQIINIYMAHAVQNRRASRRKQLSLRC